VLETLGIKLWYDVPATSETTGRDWYVVPEWEKVPQPCKATTGARAAGKGSLLIFADRAGFGKRLYEAGRSHGFTCRVLEMVRRGECDEVMRELERLQPSELSGITHIVDCLPLDDAELVMHESSDLDAAILAGPGSLARTVQKLLAAKVDGAPRVWVLTRGTHNVGGSGVMCPTGGMVWGMGRSLALEHTGLWGGLIDLDPESRMDREAIDVLAEISAQDEDQIAFRKGKRYVLRLSPFRHLGEDPERPFRCDGQGAYIVTGGLGGLGLHVAALLADRGARTLVLAGRTPLPAREVWNRIQEDDPQRRRVRAVLELESKGVEVRVVAIDVGDRDQMMQLRDALRRDHVPPLRGIVHAAGILQYGALSDLTMVQLADALRAKVHGGWLLHEVFGGEPLKFFIMFSSASALLSSPMLSAYAAGNAFLDALAHYRRNLGRPATSINWGVWSEAGMATTFDGGGLQASAIQGMGTLTTREGLNVLRCLFSNSLTQIAVIPVDWKVWAARYPSLARAPAISRLVGSCEVKKDKPRADTASLQAVLDATPESLHTSLQAYLAERIGVVIGVSPSRINVTEPLSTFGIDSLMAVEIRNKVDRELHVNIPMVRFLQGPTVEELAGLVAERLPQQAGPSASSAAASEGEGVSHGMTAEVASSLLDELPNLSDDQVDDLLRRFTNGGPTGEEGDQNE
jgi:acyl carrier protein/NADP-dependent 3-hydroxy acid dehydrogenase YdfG